MDGTRFTLRLRFVAGIMAGILLLFFGVLYNLQIVNVDDYRRQATARIANQETVEAARGELTDRYGRVLVSNKTIYEVTLDRSTLGEEAQRNATLLKLLEICREEGVVWTDTLPISDTAPFVYTMDQTDSNTRKSFSKLMETMGTSWKTAAADGLELAAAMDSDGAAAVTQTEGGSLSEAVARAAQHQWSQAQSDGLRRETPGQAPEQETAVSGVSAQPLISKMREYFEVDPAVSDEEGRALVGVLYEMLLRTKDVSTSEYVFASDVDISFITKVKEAGLAGVKIDTTTARTYNTNYAAHLLGRVGSIYYDEWYADDSYYRNNGYNMNDTVGKEGVEKAFESYLRGEAGVRTTETNANGKVVSETWVPDENGELQVPQPGNNVMLTIDERLQEAVETSLSQRVPGMTDQVKGASAVVLDMSGGVLAMASYPTFDLSIYSDSAAYNQVSQDPLAPLYNRAIQGLYSPGSTFKMITGVAALQEGYTTPGEEILDTGRFQYPAGEKYPYGDYHPACWYYLQYGGKHGWENMGDAIRDSCNIFFFTLADRMGIDIIDEYASMFGLGQKTGIEITGEKTGRVAGPAASEALGQEWYDGLLLSAAIGQGTTECTPIQLANYIVTLVNGGNRYPVHLLKTVKTSDYSQVVEEYSAEPLDSINISEENLETVKEGIGLMASEGSVAKYFKDLPVKVGAKTGTAQVGSATAESNAVFVCFAPYDDPEIAISIVVERGGSGTELGAIAADIVSAYFGSENTNETVTTENTLLR
ncbi:MAG TPA: penicillin-binding protein [Candidatus Flavonifractor merdipullorum]|uniref:Penicillin-binding protein n=1 Tax=Candidatus Flavonifractor merdipullorum TaxID=2838590 RepID=A0A9D1RV70_9FIRM|nr:penicillin-binding protein [Candidatus Flavonifractor merdipullorum]